jgi:hypothetical protein
MSTLAVITQIGYLVKKAKAVANKFSWVQICQNKEQYCALQTLRLRLERATAYIAERIERLVESRAKQVRIEGEKFLRKAENARVGTIGSNQMKNIITVLLYQHSIVLAI